MSIWYIGSVVAYVQSLRAGHAVCAVVVACPTGPSEGTVGRTGGRLEDGVAFSANAVQER